MATNEVLDNNGVLLGVTIDDGKRGNVAALATFEFKATCFLNNMITTITS